MSRYSPCVVDDDEILARFAFNPIHYDKKGNLKPSIFSHVANRGCSIQRETIAKDDEIGAFVADFLKGDAKRKWLGVLMAETAAVRSIKVAENSSAQAICVYDTAERHNPAHAEMCHSKIIEDDGDANELRKNLMDAFRATNPIAPAQYRRGEIVGRSRDGSPINEIK